MKLDSLVPFFEDRLVKEMPGEEAHLLMQPTMRNGGRIRMSHTDPPKMGGVMILLYEENGSIKFPMIQRPIYDGVHSGQIALPGGGIESSDVDQIETALRETEEEIGVNRNDIKVLGSLSEFFVAASNYDILPVIGHIKGVPEFSPDKREVHDIITPKLLDLVDKSNRMVKEINVKNGVILNSPYFNLSGQVVWGATAMMLSELLVILNEYQASQ
jgi:8-oxo-dGTP pyrophosphatase MutT (NUDIX family)